MTISINTWYIIMTKARLDTSECAESAYNKVTKHHWC